MKLRISCPITRGGCLREETQKSIDNLIESKIFEEVQIGTAMGPYIQKNRNRSINALWNGKGFLDNNDQRQYQELGGYDYLLSLDSDIEFTPDHVSSLLTHDLPLVSAGYLYRGNKELLTCGKFINDVSGLIGPMNFVTADSSGMNELDWFGGGFWLGKREVIQSMAFPWFYQSVVRYKAAGLTMCADVPEDVGFCINARSHGYGIFVDCDTKVIHHIED